MQRRKGARRQTANASLTITSLMDTMTIILVFLLMNFGADDVAAEPSDDLRIPSSTADAPARYAVNVVVSRRSVSVDGEWVLDLERSTDTASGQETYAIPDDAMRDQTIGRLYDLLRAKAERSPISAPAPGAQSPAAREVLLQVDRRMPFSVVREVLFTAGQADYGSFRFVVISTTAG